MGMVAALNKWMEMASERARREQLLRHAAQRLRNRMLAMAWTTWYERVMQLLHEKRCMSGALTRWIKQKMSQAYNSWLARTNECKHMEWKMTQSLVSWCLRDMAKGFNKWRYVAWAWNAKKNAAERLMQGRVLEAYQVPVPVPLIPLTAPIPEIEDLPASNLA